MHSRFLYIFINNLYNHLTYLLNIPAFLYFLNYYTYNKFPHVLSVMDLHCFFCKSPYPIFPIFFYSYSYNLPVLAAAPDIPIRFYNYLLYNFYTSLSSLLLPHNEYTLLIIFRYFP